MFEVRDKVIPRSAQYHMQHCSVTPQASLPDAASTAVAQWAAFYNGTRSSGLFFLSAKSLSSSILTVQVDDLSVPRRKGNQDIAL